QRHPGRDAFAAGDPHRADRVRAGRRPGWLRFGREPSAARRQRHRFYQSGIWVCGEMGGINQRNRAWSDASSGASRCYQFLRYRLLGGSPVGSFLVRHRVDASRDNRRQRDRARRHRIRAHLERRPDCDGEHVDHGSSRVDYHAGGSAPTACGLRFASLCQRWRPNLLWPGFDRPVSSRGRIRRSYPQGREAWRPARAGADQVPARHQPKDRQDARARDPGNRTRPCRRGDRMKRREFISLLGGAAAAWPLAAHAQQGERVRRVGVIGPRPENAGFSGGVGAGYPAMLDELRKLGFSEGRNLAAEFRSVEQEPRSVYAAADELVRSNPDVIVAIGPELGLQAVVAATSTIPIVIAAFNYDPIARGYVKSLAQPGGNITGVFLRLPELAEKQVEILTQTFPDRTRLA